MAQNSQGSRCAGRILSSGGTAFNIKLDKGQTREMDTTLRTPLCKHLGIKHPIMLAGMAAVYVGMQLVPPAV